MITVGLRSPVRLGAQIIDISEINDLIITKAVTWWDVVWAGLVLLAGL